MPGWRGPSLSCASSPGAADTIHYRLKIPEDCGDTIRLRAKVNYRKFQWWNTQFSFAGVRDPGDPSPAVGPGYDDGKWVFTGDTSKVSGGMKKIPSIPTTVMATSEATLKVAAKGANLPATSPSWTSRPVPMGGTTTASASSCKATSRGRKPRS